MIPLTNALFEQDFEIEEQPTKTYKINQAGNSVNGYVDKLEAMKQVIYKIINTERYEYVMYSWDYGIELKDLYGEPLTYVCPELERRITEALIFDTRIEEVTDFEFDTSQNGTVCVSFRVNTIFGTINVEKEVNI